MIKLLSSSRKSSDPLAAIEQAVLRYKFLILAWLSTATVIFLNILPASAQVDFGGGVDKVKGNAVISAAGTEAVNLFAFVFAMAGMFILAVVLYAVIGGMSQLLSGRDWITPFIGLAGLLAIVIFGAGIYQLVANSGLL
jgi:hypothetical protein